ncbi:MAG: hypothetical protein WDZ37_07190 [Solirubrobacterales bacterium]
MAVHTTKVKAGTECRQCCAFCDKMIMPRECIAAQCPFLYTYENEKTGRRYMGCLQKVFGVEIDVDMFEHAERTRQGFGGVKAAREPLPMCPIKVERSYEGSGPAFDCTNAPFFDASQLDPGGYRAFDLRESLIFE